MKSQIIRIMTIRRAALAVVERRARDGNDVVPVEEPAGVLKGVAVSSGCSNRTLHTSHLRKRPEARLPQWIR
jgi:hypothetical protein